MRSTAFPIARGYWTVGNKAAVQNFTRDILLSVWSRSYLKIGQSHSLLDVQAICIFLIQCHNHKAVLDEAGGQWDTCDK